jgi:hypothetical protein
MHSSGAIVTVTTAGDGDIYPVTVAGRIIASFLMFIGIAILGIFISMLDASIIESRLSKELPTPQTPLKLKDEAKTLIKMRIDNLEELKNDEVKLLVSMIINLHKTYTYYYKQCIDGMDEFRREAWSLYKYGDWSQGVHLTVKEKIAALRLLKECNEAKFRLLEKGPSVLSVKGME